MEYKSLEDYSSRLQTALRSIDQTFIDNLTREILKRINGNGEIFLIGNGGSAANGHHIAGDYSKTFSMMGKRIRINSLSDNECYVTAAANDIGYEEIYEILINTRVIKNDLLIFLSGSGNSINLIKAARKAKIFNIKSSAVLGYNGGALKDIVDIPIHAKINDMDIAEDCQMSIFHFIKQKLVKTISPNYESESTKYNKRTQEDLIA